MKLRNDLVWVMLLSLLVGCSSPEKSLEKEVVKKQPTRKVQSTKNHENDLDDLVYSSSERKVPEKKDDFKIIKGIMVYTNEAGYEKPVIDKSVVLQNEEYEQVAETTTAKDGSFRFTIPLKDGEYSLIYDNGTYHRVFTLDEAEKDFGTLNINPRFD